MQGPCKHCGHTKDNHNGMTRACPVGRKTRIGYIHYSNVTVYEPRPEKARGVLPNPTT